MPMNPLYDSPIKSLYLVNTFASIDAAKINHAQGEPYDYRPVQVWFDPNADANEPFKTYPAYYNEVKGEYVPGAFQVPTYFCASSNVGSKSHNTEPVPCRLLNADERLVYHEGPFSPDPPVWVRNMTAYNAAHPTAPAEVSGTATLDTIQTTVNAIKSFLHA